MITGTVFATAHAADGSVPLEVRRHAERSFKAVTEIFTFEGDFSGDGRPDALAFIYYAFVGGNALGLEVSLFETRSNGLTHRRIVPNVFGWQPRDVKFEPGMVKVTTTVPKPGDPRCCPTGERRFNIRP